MIEEFEFETYLSISPSKFGIYLFDKKNSTNLYNEEIEIQNKTDLIDYNYLIEFLENNIFKIEKFIGKFIKNIFLVIENKRVLETNFGVKKKNYEEIISKKFLENILIDAKDLFKDNYQNDKIMHILVNKIIIDENDYLFFENNLRGDNFCMEIKIKFLPYDFHTEIDRILEKYHIKIIRYLDGNYIKNFTNKCDMDYPEMIYRVQNGFNDKEVKLIPTNVKKKGFFEKFFQLFS